MPHGVGLAGAKQDTVDGMNSAMNDGKLLNPQTTMTLSYPSLHLKQHGTKETALVLDFSSP